MKKSKVYFEMIPIKKLKCEPSGIKVMTEDEYARLKDSIQEVGILSPLQVFYIESEELYQILDGRHRYRAALELGIETLPCIVETSEVPHIITAHIYDSELIRKMYSQDEIEKFLAEKEKQSDLLKERLISSIASDVLPREFLEKIVQGDSVNSLSKMHKLVNYITQYNQEQISKLKEELSRYKEELSEKEKREKELKEKLETNKKAMEEIKVRFDEEVNRKSRELLEKEIAKLQEISKQELTAEKITQLKEEIRKEVAAEFKQKIAKKMQELEQESEEIRQNLVDLSKKYQEANNIMKEKEEKIRELVEKVKALEKINKNLQITKEQQFEKIKKISTFRTIDQRVQQIHTDLDLLRNSIVSYSAEGFEENELAKLKGQLKKIQEFIEIIVQEVNQIKPVTYYTEDSSVKPEIRTN